MRRSSHPGTWAIPISLAFLAAQAWAQSPVSPPPLSPSSAAMPAQEFCPVTTDEKIDRKVFTEYKGQRVYFCCQRCRTKFEREPELYAAHLAADDPPQGADGAPRATGKSGDHHHAHANDDEQRDAEAAPKPPGKDEHAGAHDHDHGGATALRWVSWLGNFHPPMTSFPIGVVVAAAIGELLFILRRDSRFDHAARFGVAFAAITGVATAVLGWCFGGFRLIDSDPLLRMHRWLGTGAALWLLVLLWASERARRGRAVPSEGGELPVPHRRGFYRFLLFAGVVLVLTTGFFGGAMVYGLDHYAW